MKKKNTQFSFLKGTFVPLAKANMCLHDWYSCPSRKNVFLSFQEALFCLSRKQTCSLRRSKSVPLMKAKNCILFNFWEAQLQLSRKKKCSSASHKNIFFFYVRHNNASCWSKPVAPEKENMCICWKQKHVFSRKNIFLKFHFLQNLGETGWKMKSQINSSKTSKTHT